MATPHQDRWVNDVVISYYVRQHLPPYGRTFCFDCQFFALMLAAYNRNKRDVALMYRDMYGMTEMFPYKKFTCVMIPVCMDNHWGFDLIQNPAGVLASKPYFLHVDALLAHSTATPKKIVGGFFNCERAMKFGENEAIKYSTKTIQTSPKQTNYFDCGIFTLYFMKKVCQELLEAGNEPLLLLSIQTWCTAPRALRFNAAAIRPSIAAQLRDDAL